MGKKFSWFRVSTFASVAIVAATTMDAIGDVNITKGVMRTVSPARHVPPKAVVPPKAKELTSGYYHTCALMQKGDVQCWGANSGRLGNNNTANSPSPVQVVDTTGSGMLSGVTSVSAATSHTCAVKSGSVYCWGINTYGQLGVGDTTTRLYPVQVKDAAGTGVLTGIKAVAAGGSHTCALTTAGAVWCWGLSSMGQVGDNVTCGTGPTDYSKYKTLPAQVKDPAGTGTLSGITSIMTALRLSCGIDSTGKLYCWGGRGGLFFGTQCKPSQVFSAISSIQSVWAGDLHTCAVAAGNVYCQGDNGFGELGNNTTTGSYGSPVQVVGIGATGFLTGAKGIGSGNYHNCVLLNDGSSVPCWGDNGSANVGDGTTNNQRNAPIKVKDAAGTGFLSGIQSVSVGSYFGCAVANNTTYCWGNNGYGQVGNGTAGSDVKLPVLVGPWVAD